MNHPSMITVDLRSRKPIYEQIVDNVKNLVLTGILKPDEQLPAVRKLAVDLTINPNTIQKAYTILEAQQIVYSIPGRGIFISGELKDLFSVKRLEIIGSLKNELEEAVAVGISKDEIISLINAAYGKKTLEKES